MYTFLPFLLKIRSSIHVLFFLVTHSFVKVFLPMVSYVLVAQ